MTAPRDDRFQHQPWYVRLWRRRHYWRVPYDAWTFYWADRRTGDPWGWGCAWSVAIGMAQGRMNWVYDWDEVKRDLGWDEDT